MQFFETQTSSKIAEPENQNQIHLLQYIVKLNNAKRADCLTIDLDITRDFPTVKFDDDFFNFFRQQMSLMISDSTFDRIVACDYEAFINENETTQTQVEIQCDTEHTRNELKSVLSLAVTDDVKIHRLSYGFIREINRHFNVGAEKKELDVVNDQTYVYLKPF
jgi:hypothetical protein